MARSFWYGGPYDGFEEVDCAGQSERRVESALMDGNAPLVHMYDLVVRDGKVLIYIYRGPTVSKRARERRR